MTVTIGRRELLAALGGARSRGRSAHAQQAATPVIGFLGPESPAQWGGRLRAFHQGLGEAGYIEGRNVTIEYRWAESQNNRIPDLVAELVRRQSATIRLII